MQAGDESGLFNGHLDGTVRKTAFSENWPIHNNMTGLDER
jgi:hypothetical protein